MRRSLILSAALATAVLFAAETGAGSAPVAAEPEAGKKSIVPSKYAGKYKNGGSDALAEVIKDQCKDKDGNFEFAYFFDLCRKNGVKEEQVAKYEGLLADKANNPGIEGRSRMTLRNMLAAIVRKEGKIIARDGEEIALDLPKPAASGAAAAAQANSASTTGTETGQVETAEVDDEVEGDTETDDADAGDETDDETTETE